MIKYIIKFLRKTGILKKILPQVNKVGISRFLITGAEFRQIMNMVEPGDAVVITAFGETTTLLERLVGDKLTHTAIASINRDYIVDATEEGFKIRDILELHVGVSRIAIKRPNLPVEERIKIAQRAEFYATQKIEYDYNFLIGNKDLYCSEAYYKCYDDINPGKMSLEEKMGEKVITPDDIYACNDLLYTVVEFGKK